MAHLDPLLLSVQPQGLFYGLVGPAWSQESTLGGALSYSLGQTLSGKTLLAN